MEIELASVKEMLIKSWQDNRSTIRSSSSRNSSMIEAEITTDSIQGDDKLYKDLLRRVKDGEDNSRRKFLASENHVVILMDIQYITFHFIKNPTQNSN